MDSTALIEEEDATLEVVQLDGLVVLKILKHCRENLPEFVTGQLLGLDIGTTLEVTNSFPFPKIVEETEDETTETETLGGAEYQIEMMRCLREVNVDHNTVGWYSSTYMNAFQNEDTIETQYSYQERIKKSVMVIYDPLKSTQGYLSLRAFRLTPAFMELRKNNQITKEGLGKANVSYNNIFEEIPIRIHNSELIKAFLTDLEESSTTDSDLDRLDLSTNPFLEKNLEVLGECLDELAQEQNKFQYYQRNLQRQMAQRQAWLQKRRAENAQRKLNGETPLPEEDPSNPIFKPLPEPKRLDALLLTNQISSYCKEINRFSGNSFTKLFLATNLNGMGTQ